MEAAQERLAAIINTTRKGLESRLRSAILVASLLAALIWFTQWPSLRAGLSVLLVVQCGIVITLLLRRRGLVRESQEIKKYFDVAGPVTWFNEQARFLRALAVFESCSRAVGFLALGWGFWTATRSVGIAFLLGVGYPLFAYFGLDRPRQARALRTLRVEEDAFAMSIRGSVQDD